ncbi:putative wall-associated receptor kinase, galacturonan-binding domain-containing protein [Helianthus annuus]|nr:putative wall-associated receptor kinase, galacturonan-binding domain-containing protein [Helianthus annuus]
MYYYISSLILVNAYDIDFESPNKKYKADMQIGSILQYLIYTYSIEGGLLSNISKIMSHHLYPQPFSFLLLLSFFFIALNAESNNSTYPNCPSYRCGDVNISYPFWKMDSESTSQICGYEGFGIKCSDNGERNISDITLGGESYLVRGIDYVLENIFLADYDVSQVTRVPNNCPRVRHNINLGNLPLNFASYSVNLSFHFNCTGFPSFAMGIPCLDENERKACVHIVNASTEETDWDLYSCTDEVVTTVSKEFVDMFRNLTGNFSNVLERGFGLRWGPMDDCENCEESGGRCGRHNGTRFICFCSDGTTKRGNCKA